MRRLALAALAFVSIAGAASAENDPRWNGTYDRLARERSRSHECVCRSETVPGSFHWVANAGVDARSQRINRFRSVHSAPLWRARAFGVSRRGFGGHGFHGRRFHGRRR